VTPPASTERKGIISPVKRLVIKVGTSIITDDDLSLSQGKIQCLASDIHGLPPGVKEVIIVSSGAIASGRTKSAWGREKNIPQKQALAAMGQSGLMQAYEKAFSRHSRPVAQVLLTREDCENRRRFINARNTFFTLLSWGVVPVVNENDTVAVEEIKVGDNDTLSALVTNLVEADLLIILSDVDGLYEGDPKTDRKARLIPVVKKVDRGLMAMAGESISPTGTGGMATKLSAAAMVMDLGVPVIVANGHTPGIIGRVMGGEEAGTLFSPEKSRMASRKHWILHTLRPRGELVVDRGGVEAIIDHGKSLLPVGILEVKGRFETGDAVRCLSEEGLEFARGLANYTSREVDLLRGHRSDEIESILGYKYYDEVIHRDDLVIVGPDSETGGR
jgi:glutamate 5-kinase